MTKEHIYGNWISRFFVEQYGKSLTGKVELVDSQGNITDFNMTPFQHTAKLVCEECNGGWTSDLEASVMQDLRPMMLGKPKQLRGPAQRRLAFWCAKTALVIDRIQPEVCIVPDAHYSALHDRQAALPDQVVLVGYRSVTYNGMDGLLGGALMQPVTNFVLPEGWAPNDVKLLEDYIQNGRKIYKITFFVGNFVALVFGHDFPINMRIDSPNPVTKHIWPINQRFRWSDELSVDSIGGVVGFHTAFAPSPRDDKDLPPAMAEGFTQTSPSLGPEVEH